MHLQTQSEANVGWILINRARTERMQFQFVHFFSRSTQVILPPGSYVRCDLNLNPEAVTGEDSAGPETKLHPCSPLQVQQLRTTP